MTYFDPKKRTAVATDASPVGISAILEQEGKVISYASRSLTEVEGRYSQTEREALALSGHVSTLMSISMVLNLIL